MINSESLLEAAKRLAQTRSNPEQWFINLSDFVTLRLYLKWPMEPDVLTIVHAMLYAMNQQVRP